MTPPKLTIPLLSGLLGAHLVTRLRFYDLFTILPFFVVLIRRFLVNNFNAKRAWVNNLTFKHLNSMTRPHG